jgi:heparin binding hemagglutinin HbhA
MSIATDVRAYADLALEQGKSALSQAGTAVVNANKRLTADAPKPVLAALGVADLVADALGKQAEALGKQAGYLGKRVESLPSETAGGVVKVQETSMALISRTQDDAMGRLAELRERLDTGVGTVKALPQLSVVAASTTTVYLSNARQAFDKLTARGEARLSDLRKDPRVSKLLGEVDEAGTAIGVRLDSVRSDVVPYLEEAVETIKDADLGQPAPRAGRRSGTPRGAARPATRTSTRNAVGSTTSGTRRAAAAKSTADKAAPAARSTARKAAPAAKSTARKAAPAAKTTARTAPAKSSTARTAPAKSGTARKTPAKKA